MLNVPATYQCTSGTDLLGQFYVRHTETEIADQTFRLIQSQYTDTGPTSPSTDPITPGAWQGCHWNTLLTYAHRSQWSIGHQRPPAIALCSGLLLSFRTSWSPAVSVLLQCLTSNCCEAGLSSSSPAGSRSGLGVWCWMLAS